MATLLWQGALHSQFVKVCVYFLFLGTVHMCLIENMEIDFEVHAQFLKVFK